MLSSTSKPPLLKVTQVRLISVIIVMNNKGNFLLKKEQKNNTEKYDFVFLFSQ